MPKRSTRIAIQSDAKRTEANDATDSSAQPNTADTNAASTVAGAEVVDDITSKLDYRTIPRPLYSMADPDEDEDEEEDITDEAAAEKLEARQAELDAEAEKYDEKPASEHPEWPFIVSTRALALADKYGLDLAKRNQDNFSMHVYNDFTGYGIQEVFENWLVEFNKLWSKKPEADAVDLWIHLSGLAHVLGGAALDQWMMLEDGDRWRMTGGIIGAAILATLNTLDRKGLLKKDSPIKDLGLVFALLGNFVTDCVSLTGDVPCVSDDDETDEENWPYVFVRYAKSNGIEIAGVHEIEENFVEEFDDEEEASLLKGRKGVDRWGWKEKWAKFVKAYHPKANARQYDIFKMSARERKAASYEKGGKDPLDPKNPRNVLEMFQDAEKRIAESAAKLK